MRFPPIPSLTTATCDEPCLPASRLANMSGESLYSPCLAPAGAIPDWTPENINQLIELFRDESPPHQIESPFQCSL